MDDLISRQATIDKAIKIPVARIVTEDKVLWRKAVFVEDIEALPPAQQVLTCKGCKYDGYYKHVQCRNCLRKERDLYEPE